MHDIFISYSSMDKDAADAICHHLEENNIRCWVAHRNIKPGEEWTVSIMSAIRKARIFVLVYSKNSNMSKQVMNEVSNAFSANCVLIPFRLDMSPMSDTLSYYLHGVHWLDATKGAMRQSLDDLYRTVRAVLDARQRGYTPTPKPVDPPKPRKKLPVWLWSLMGIVTNGLFILLLVSSVIGWLKPTDPDAYFFCVSHNGYKVYQGIDTKMCSANGEQILLWDKETEEYVSVDVASPYTERWRVNTVLEDPPLAMCIQTEDSNYVYFVDEYAHKVDIYDKAKGCWTAEDLIISELGEYEWIGTYGWYNANLLMDPDRVDTIYLIYVDNVGVEGKNICFSKIISVNPDGSYTVTDISQLKLQHMICRIEDEWQEGFKTLMLDENCHPVIVDLVSGQVISRDLAVIYKSYMQNAQGANSSVSPDGRYVTSYDSLANGERRGRVWDLKTGKAVFSQNLLSGQCIFYLDAHTVIYFDHNLQAVCSFDLEAAGSPVCILDRAYFAQSGDFESKLCGFWYSEEFDRYFFVTKGEKILKDEKYFLLTVTDRSGNVVAVSDKFVLDHTDVFLDLRITKEAILLVFTSESGLPTQYSEYTTIYRALYAVDADGNLKFKDSYQ